MIGYHIEWIAIKMQILGIRSAKKVFTFNFIVLSNYFNYSGTKCFLNWFKDKTGRRERDARLGLADCPKSGSPKTTWTFENALIMHFWDILNSKRAKTCIFIPDSWILNEWTFQLFEITWNTVISEMSF